MKNTLLKIHCAFHFFRETGSSICSPHRSHRASLTNKDLCISSQPTQEQSKLSFPFTSLQAWYLLTDQWDGVNPAAQEPFAGPHMICGHDTSPSNLRDAALNAVINVTGQRQELLTFLW